jgi:hypothetical protein
MRPRRSRAAPLTRSAFAGFCFPSDVIVLADRWYLRFGLSYRDVEELLADRGVEVDHTTIYRWVQRFTPLVLGRWRVVVVRVGVGVPGDAAGVVAGEDLGGGGRSLREPGLRGGGSESAVAGGQHDRGRDEGAGAAPQVVAVFIKEADDPT